MTDIAIRSAHVQGLLINDRTVTQQHGSVSGGDLTTRRMQPRSASVSMVESGPEPQWLRIMIDDLQRAGRLGEDWDSYGAKPLQVEAAFAGLRLLADIGYLGPPPHVSPTNNGWLHLEWSIKGLDVEVEIDADGLVSVLVDEEGDVREWTTGPRGDIRLKSALDAVAAQRP